ncbi:MAG: transporter substrate-binding domain-containing protein [Rhizobiales bacterium]|nr:transporter substrate-binding domain-containing protein [Hyphomicrobiales bacterium]
MHVPEIMYRQATDIVLGALCLGLFFFALLSGLPRAEDDVALRIAAPLLPPQMDLDGRGREADIVQAAFEAAGLNRRIEFHIMPFTRHWKSYASDQRLDAVITVPKEVTLKGVRSEPYIYYQNGVFYDRSSIPGGLGNNPIGALELSRIVTFAGSTAVLKELGPLSERAPMYIERADQLSHSVVLASGFVDVVIADELIFDFYTRQVGASVAGTVDAPPSRELVFDPIFCPTPYQVVFRSFELRELFNSGLSVIQKNGTLEKINSDYHASRGVQRLDREGCLK